ncbi:MAG: hypothetical protein WAM52_15935 [Steroidobacteraceae bacterium]
MVEPAIGADPEAANAVICKGPNMEVTDAASPHGQDDEVVAIRVVSRQAAGDGTNPQTAAGVGVQTRYPNVR